MTVAKRDELIHQAATMCRQRGRVVLVGVIGLNLQRADFYEKEISFQVSCSYGPGRYDDNYEKRGLDYPIGFVRWTEQRNFQAVLDLMADGKIDVAPLITHRFSFDNALDGYQAVSEPGAMGILLEYPEEESPGEASNKSSQKIVLTKPAAVISGQPKVAFIGAGGFTTRMLLPLLPKKFIKKTIVSSTGVSAAHAGKKFGFQEISSDSDAAINDPDVDAVFITTPHNSHARFVCDALKANKHVFVEKPLAMNLEEIEMVEAELQQHPDRILMIGFNRRFSPHITGMKKWLSGCQEAKAIVITVNAGAIPGDHWTQDPEVGGGRIIGEACHFIDLARFLADSPITKTDAVAMGGEGRLGDCVSIQLTFENGSIANVHYLANGNKSFPKERIEVFSSGRILTCDNFRVSREIGGAGKIKTKIQDKGHANELSAFFDAITSSGVWPIPAKELIEVSKITIEAARQIRQNINSH